MKDAFGIIDALAEFRGDTFIFLWSSFSKS